MLHNPELKANSQNYTLENVKQGSVALCASWMEIVTIEPCALPLEAHWVILSFYFPDPALCCRWVSVQSSSSLPLLSVNTLFKFRSRNQLFKIKTNFINEQVSWSRSSEWVYSAKLVWVFHFSVFNELGKDWPLTGKFDQLRPLPFWLVHSYVSNYFMSFRILNDLSRSLSRSIRKYSHLNITYGSIHYLYF